MPICNKPPPAIGSKSASEIDDHASEAAKVKRTREQAYFNSYDFDAIEVLPSEGGDDDAEDADDGKRGGKRALNQHHKLSLKVGRSLGSGGSKNTSATLYRNAVPPLSPHSRRRRLQQAFPHFRATKSHSSGVPSSASASSSNRSSGRGSYTHTPPHNEMECVYLQRLGAFLANNSHSERSPSSASTSGQSSRSTSGGNSEPLKQREVPAGVRGGADATVLHVDGENGNNFLLPRAMLKYQSVGITNSNSMPLAAISTAHAQTGKLLQNGNGNGNGGGNSSNGSQAIMMSTNINSSSATNTPRASVKTRLGYTHEDQATSFLTAAAATATATEATTNRVARNKKSSISSTTTGSVESVEQAAGTKRVGVANDARGDAVNAAAEDAVDGGGVVAGRITISGKKSKKPVHSGATQSEQRARASSHQSHYSTEKSGSSGYYSSNVCSTYSLDDHIYCEPAIDILDLNSQSKSVVGGKVGSVGVASVHIQHAQQQQNVPPTLSKTVALSAKVAQHEPPNNSRLRAMQSSAQSKSRYIDAAAVTQNDTQHEAATATVDGVASPVHVSLRHGSHFSENLRILETSIENLDRHLKKYPSLSSQERIASVVQSHHTYLHHLPTIMEGYDPASKPRLWRHDIEPDSLLDIDLDSFLLVNERKGSKRGKAKQSCAAVGGLDNPTFLTDEQEENNLKCAKYINSCPEDAYRVESDIVAETGALSEKSVSVDHFPKRYEDQLHFQCTRELLEDVRDKIRLLSQSSSELRSSADSHAALQEQLPTELHSMIQTLKYELECYLDRMNQHSELEIRQLCSGLVKHHNIVKMKKAFERRRSVSSLSAPEPDYEAIRDADGTLVPFSGVPLSIRQQINSIRCASDPNFKMKRKSLNDVFPAAACYLETVNEIQRCMPPSLPLSLSRGAHKREKLVVAHCQGKGTTTTTTLTQMQRNLSFHKPTLNQLDSTVGPSGLGTVGGLAGAGSGTESGEFGDKDSILESHSKKPSIWEMYYGTNRLNQSLLGKRSGMVHNHNAAPTMSYPSSRPESDFTLDLPRAEQLRIKMEKEKKFRQRCRYITTFLSLVFFLLTVMVVSLVLTRGKRMFGSMI